MISWRLWPVAVGLWLSLNASVNVYADPLDNWTLRRTNSAETLLEITYANGTFVAVGYKGVILTSPDGKEWTQRNSGVSNDLRRIKFCRDKFYALTGGDIALTSKDGVIWSATNTVVAGWGSLTTILWTNDLFVAAVSAQSIRTSTDCVTWTTRFSTDQPYVLDVIFAGGIYVATGGFNILASADGVNWTNVAHPMAPGSFLRVTYGRNTFVIVAYFGGSAPSVIMTSTNGQDWTMRDANADYELDNIIFANGRFVAVGGRGNIVTSEDAVNWTERNSGTGQAMAGVTYGRGTVVAVGPLGLILQSDHFGPPFLTGRVGTERDTFEISVESESGSNFALQSSSDGANWSDTAGFTNAPSVVTVVESSAADSPHRFYRTISKPPPSGPFGSP